MNRIALFPGSFDPITNGHESIILRSLSLFDKVVVALGVNPDKKSMFTVEQRLQFLEKVFQPYPQIEVVSYTGLTTDLCKKLDIHYILRGLRSAADFEFERSIAQMNKKLFPEIETVFMLALPEFDVLSSSLLRDISHNGGDITPFIPEALNEQFRK
jgi:pantetheine-phosphate adenylyltransferase